MRIPRGRARCGWIVAAAAAAMAMPVVAQEPPLRLVVLISVDQLRADYLDAYAGHFGERGFARLLRDGARFVDATYAQSNTKTCVGHAVMATGAYPSEHGIIGNDWWHQGAQRLEYCARDESAPLLGSDAEGRSPRNLIGSTVGDELKLATGGRARVITVAGKDRSAIMLGGHLADAAYWARDTLFVTSHYYRATMPDWAVRFNGQGRFTAYFGRAWDRLLPASAYAGVDDRAGERNRARMGRAFPHVLGVDEETPGARFVDALEYSPFHNELVLEFALEAIRAEDLGRDDVPDLLGIGFSANDRVGHAYGPGSHEVQDVTVRTDRLLARLLDFLDEHVGLQHTVVALTADHGVAPLPESVLELQPRSGARRLHYVDIAAVVDSALAQQFGAVEDGWVGNAESPSVYLRPDALAERNVAADSAARVAQRALRAVDGIGEVLTRSELQALRAAGTRTPMLLSFHPARSGDLMYTVLPWVLAQSDRDGTTHGTPWRYDSHVPLVFFGRGIRAARIATPVSVADLAPTLAHLLGVPRPAAASGRPLLEAFR